jgi:hypothetical protein
VGVPVPTAEAALSGFLTLPALCSPRDLSGLFHPESVCGVLPSRFVPPHDGPSGLSTLATLLKLAKAACAARLFFRACNHRPASSPEALGVSQEPETMTSLGFAPSRESPTVVLQLQPEAVLQTSPLALSQRIPRVVTLPAPQGFFH